MSLQGVPAAERVQIGFFGCQNAGKSSLINAVTGQRLAVVSSVRGTTTDPVVKTMELLPLGPVVLIDTPGLDDTSELGEARIEKAQQILRRIDIGILVVDAAKGFQAMDRTLLRSMEEKQLPHLVVFNKCDRFDSEETGSLMKERLSQVYPGEGIFVSAKQNIGIEALKEAMGHLVHHHASPRFLLRDIVRAGDTVVLVTPMDESAPKGRLILPQQMVIRELVDIQALCLIATVESLPLALQRVGHPRLVITDSQVFAAVAEIIPETVPLTSFSILMARYKGFLETAVQGVRALHEVKDGDTVLIAEGCTHHRQCNDIGTVQIPRLLASYTGKHLSIQTVSGHDYPEDLTPFAAVIHCGGCMMNAKEMVFRRERTVAQGVPFINYGIFLAEANHILARCLAPIPLHHA